MMRREQFESDHELYHTYCFKISNETAAGIALLLLLQICCGILALKNETEGKNDMWCHLYLYGLSKLYSCMSKCEPNKNYGLMSLLLQLLEGLVNIQKEVSKCVVCSFPCIC